jgi:high-affinity iron transporter
VLGNFLIGLREGLEASLIVSILIAYLVKSDRRREIRFVWWGVAAAIALAVVMVTWMIFWMRRTARHLKRELESSMSKALELGPLALATVAFLTVGREGLETSAIVWATIIGSTTSGPFVGSILGILVAVALGWLIYRGALRINLSVFFTVTGALLIIVAAGVLAYGIYDLQEARVLPGLNNVAFDITNIIPKDSWYGTLLKGTVNFQPDPSWLQVIAWIAYVVPVLWLYLRKPSVTTPREEQVRAV